MTALEKKTKLNNVRHLWLWQREEIINKILLLLFFVKKYEKINTSNVKRVLSQFTKKTQHNVYTTTKESLMFMYFRCFERACKRSLPIMNGVYGRLEIIHNL